MSLKETAAEILSDVVDSVAPYLARRSGGLRRVAVAENGALVIYEVVRGKARPAIGTAKGRPRGPVRMTGELRLPPDVVLSHDLSFPAATQGYLEPVLDNRLEKLTPWAPDRVLYGYRVVEEREDGSLSVAFAATARDVAEDWTARAEAQGFTPTAIGSAAEPLAEPLAVDLWRGSRDLLKARLRRRLRAAAVYAVALPLLACAASAWMLSESESHLRSIESRIAATRAALRPGRAGDGREAALIGEKTPETAMMTLIDRLSGALPDGTALRELEIGPEEVRLAGTSEAAPELIGVLDKSGVVAGARFAAPVTRNADGKDGFEILAARKAAPAAAESRP